MADKGKSVTIEMEHEKDTKNKGRYKELGSKGVMGYAYIDLGELEKLGSPEKIKLTVTPS